MNCRALKLKGRRFGQLKVLDYFGRGKRNDTLWACVCKCGRAKVVNGPKLTKKSEPTRSCGCRKGKIGHFGNGATLEKYRRTYATWRAMQTRCLNPSCSAYRDYGGRGIKICPRWLGKDGFANFLKDMGRRPANKTLDRIKVNENYEPSNCRWATAAVQANNRRCSLAWMSAEEADTF
jgi:hypothetical protein